MMRMKYLCCLLALGLAAAAQEDDSQDNFDPTPKEPEFVGYVPYTPELGYGLARWKAPAVNVDGLPYAQGSVVANLYLDDQLQSVYSPQAGGEITDIPQDFDHGAISYVDGTFNYYTVAEFAFETMACKLVYIAPDGSRHESGKQEQEVESVHDPAADLQAKPRYDLLGRKAHPSSHSRITIGADGKKTATRANRQR